MEHGLFNYNPKFFWFLAMANGYRTVKMWAWVDDKATEVPASVSRDITYEPKPLSAPNGWMHVLFQKVDSRPFAGITD